MDAYALWTVRRDPPRGGRPSSGPSTPAQTTLSPVETAAYARGMARQGSTDAGIAWFLGADP